MTAPDQVLTDLLAAHEGGYDAMDDPICKCGWYGDLHAAHVALVVEQHTQTQTARIAELEATIARVKALAAMRRESASTFYTSVHQTAQDIDAALEGEQR